MIPLTSRPPVVIHMPTHAALKRPRSRPNSREEQGRKYTRDDFFITAAFPLRHDDDRREFIQCLRMKAFIRPEIVICQAFSRTTKKVPSNMSMNDNDVSTRVLISLVPAPYQRISILSSHSRREIKCKIIITLFLPVPLFRARPEARTRKRHQQSI